MIMDAQALLAEMGWVVSNCDLTVICESPKLSEQKFAMRQRVADLLGLDPSFVSVKAKTAEGMGSIGAGEGVAARAVVLLEEIT